VQQIRLEHAVLDYHCAPCRDAFAVERRRTKASDHGAVVNYRNLVAGDFLTQLAREKRSATIDRVSVDAFKNVPQDGSGDHGIEDDGNSRRLHLAPTQPSEGALCGNLSYFLGRLQPSQIARHREPVI